MTRKVNAVVQDGEVVDFFEPGPLSIKSGAVCGGKNYQLNKGLDGFWYASHHSSHPKSNPNFMKVEDCWGKLTPTEVILWCLSWNVDLPEDSELRKVLDDRLARK